MKCWGYKIIILLCILCSCDKFSIEQQPQDYNLSSDSEYIMVLGDIQEYTVDDECMYYYDQTLSWLYSQQKYYDIKALIQTGDITATNSVNQWQNYNKITSYISQKIPVISCIGNHDYDWNSEQKITSRENTYYSEYTSFSSTSKRIVSYFEKGRMENIIVEFKINNSTFNVIVLEFGPRVSVLNWAEDYIVNHSNENINFIVLTHEFLTSKGDLVSDDSYAKRHMISDYTNPDQIWDQLIYPYDISCVLCGHNGFNQVRYSKNAKGKEIPQVLFNLQYQENGGNGYVEIWKFPKNSKDVRMRIYDTVNREYLTEEILLFSYK